LIEPTTPYEEHHSLEPRRVGQDSQV